MRRPVQPSVQRRRLGLTVLAFGVVLLALSALLGGHSGTVAVIALICRGYGIGFLVAGAWLVIGRIPLTSITPAAEGGTGPSGERAPLRSHAARAAPRVSDVWSNSIPYAEAGAWPESSRDRVGSST